MCKYITFTDIVFKERRLLQAALADLGYTEVEEGESLALFGYHGDRRPETAETMPASGEALGING